MSTPLPKRPNNNGRKQAKRRRTGQPGGKTQYVPVQASGAPVPKGASSQDRVITMLNNDLNPKGPMRASYAQYAAEKAIIAVADPEMSDSFRWSDGTSVGKTAVCSLKKKLPVGFATGAAPANDPLSVSECMAEIRRIPQAAILVFDHNEANAAKNYTVWGATAIANQVQLATSPSYQLFATQAPVPVKFVQATANGAYQPHGPVLFAGADGQTERRYLWLDRDDALSCNLSTTNAATIQIRVWMLDPETGQIIEKDQISTGALAAGGVYGLVLPASTYCPNNIGGYFALELASSANTLGTLSSISIQGTGRALCHLSLPDYEKEIVNANAIRIIGASQMFSNRASPLNRQGKVLAVQLQRNQSFVSLIGKYSQLTGYDSALELDADNGIYSFLRPTDRDELKLTSYVTLRNGSIIDSFYPLQGTGDHLLTYINITQATGRDGVWTWDFAVEYTTNSQWRELAKTDVSPQVCMDAMMKLANLQQHFENPFHLRDIFGFAKKAANSIANATLKYGPDVLRLVEKYGPTVLNLASKFGG